MRVRLLCLLSLGLFALGCDDLLPRIGWERMTDQARGKSYAASPYFRDGKLMQAPPEDTVPAGRVTAPSTIGEGTDAAGYVATIPVPVDRALLERGRNRFETFCAACHGIDGSGESLVAHNMALRRPPSLVSEPIRSFAPGRMFHVISEGFGLMPAYAHELPNADRWAVVGYWRALSRSQASELAALPATIRAQAQEALR